MLHYAVFRTKWGYFGLAGTDEAVCRTHLPVPERQEAEQGLLRSVKSAGDNLRLDKDFQQDLQERIIAYYEGEPVDFSTDPALSLNGAGPFVHKVLLACRKIAFGQTTTYSDLARQGGSPKAARAVGGVMANNPIPLIIPCHRVLRTDGGLGGFSAPGGTTIKQKLLRHEQIICPCGSVG
jgi:methylated-DNA-[protein]-cysteine S-methyltransferase